MIRQIHLVALDREACRRRTRRDRFLSAIEERIPFAELTEAVAPIYASRFGGRRTYTPERMLRMYTVRVLYGMSDDGTEELCADSAAMQDFLLLDEMSDSLPDASTLAAFRRLLADYGLRDRVLDGIKGGVEALSYEKEWKSSLPILRERVENERTGWGNGRKKPTAFF